MMRLLIASALLSLALLSVSPRSHAQAPPAPTIADQINAFEAAERTVNETQKALSTSLAQTSGVAHVAADGATVTIYSPDGKGGFTRSSVPVSSTIAVPAPTPPAPQPAPAPAAPQVVPAPAAHHRSPSDFARFIGLKPSPKPR